MSNMNVTHLTKKAAPGAYPQELIVHRCKKCGCKWIEPTQTSTCTCPKKAAKKSEETATE